jgi:hypothetical protein
MYVLFFNQLITFIQFFEQIADIPQKEIGAR